MGSTAAKKTTAKAKGSADEVKVNAEDKKLMEAHGGSDGVVDGHNIHSRIEEVPEEDKAGPASVQSMEVRPDEREGFTGSAFDSPEAAAA